MTAINAYINKDTPNLSVSPNEIRMNPIEDFAHAYCHLLTFLSISPEAENSSTRPPNLWICP